MFINELNCDFNIRKIPLYKNEVYIRGFRFLFVRINVEFNIIISNKQKS